MSQVKQDSLVLDEILVTSLQKFIDCLSLAKKNKSEFLNF